MGRNQNMETLSRAKTRVAWLSVGSNAMLTAGKLIAGLQSGSVSIISEAAHSANDLIASGIATFSVHYADRPPDQDHPYGHEKIENISGVIEGVLIFLAAGWIIHESVGKLIHGVELEHLGAGAAIMAVSALVNLGVATMLKRTARRTRSVALEADSVHLFTDVFTSAGVFAALVVIMIGKRFFKVNLAWIDPGIAIAVALVIIHAAYEITSKSFWPLLDSAASPEEQDQVRAVIADFEKQGIDCHKLRTRRAGATLHVDFHCGFRPGVTLEQGHAVSHALKARIEETVAGAKVLIHVEPTSEAEALQDSEELLACIRTELLDEPRVGELRGLKAVRYRGEVRVEAELCVAPKVTLAEGRVLAADLERKVTSCYPEVRELQLTLVPDDGWREAIHEDDQARIRELVGEHESVFAGIHELKVISAGGRHRVDLHLAVPRLLPTVDAHAVALHIKDDIARLFTGPAEIDVHIEPCAQTCEHCHAACPERPGGQP